MSGKRKVTWRQLSTEFVVGCFFFGALLLLAMFTIILSRDTFLKPKTHRTVLFPSIAGLNEGDNVLVRGVRVGRVERIRLGGKYVHVGLALDRPLLLYPGYTVEVRYSSILGGRLLYIYEGARHGNPLLANQPLYGTAPPDLMTETGKLVQDVKVELNRLLAKIERQDLIGKLGAVAENTRVLTEDLRQGKGTLGRLIKDPALYDNALKTVEDLRSAGARVQQAAETIQATVADARAGKGTVGKLLVDDSLYRNASAILADARAGKGTVGKLLKDDSLYRDAKATVADARVTLADMRAGKGTLGKLLTDDSAYRNFQEAGADLKKAVKSLTDKQSTVGRLLTDDGQLYEKLDKSLTTVQKIADDVHSGKGTLGRLVKDPSLYEDARKTVNEAQRAIEDLREQAPISTFGNLIFGAL